MAAEVCNCTCATCDARGHAYAATRQEPLQHDSRETERRICDARSL
jgi:hypothetical protein